MSRCKAVAASLAMLAALLVSAAALASPYLPRPPGTHPGSATLLLARTGQAAVVARIDKSEQRMRVYVHGSPAYVWPVSTARRGYRTPTGSFRPFRLNRVWYSRRYHMSPMPYSIFFLGGYAVHGTYETRSLGRPVTHGCVRLHPRNAATLFALVRRYGMANTRIVITP